MVIDDLDCDDSQNCNIRTEIYFKLWKTQSNCNYNILQSTEIHIHQYLHAAMVFPHRKVSKIVGNPN